MGAAWKETRRTISQAVDAGSQALESAYSSTEDWVDKNFNNPFKIDFPKAPPPPEVPEAPSDDTLRKEELAAQRRRIAAQRTGLSDLRVSPSTGIRTFGDTGIRI